MSSFVSISIIIILFIIFCVVFFRLAIFNEKVEDKHALSLIKSLPKEITEKWIVRYSFERPEGKFSKIKLFEGNGILFVNDNKINFLSVIGEESHEFKLEDSAIYWIDNTGTGTPNAFKIEDNELNISFYAEKGKFFNSNKKKISSKQIYKKLKDLINN